LGHSQPRVADDDVRRGLAGLKEREIIRIAGDADHYRIDLEEAPGLAGLGVTRQRSRAQPRHAVASLAFPGPLTNDGDGVGHWAALVVVGGRLGIIDEFILIVAD